MAKRKGEEGDLLALAQEEFDRAADAENDNREAYLDDVEFARGGDQWDEAVKTARERDSRPCLTINKMQAFIRQVINDARQNKPAIKVHPADSGADVKVAEIINGLIRNIEYTSNADVAYDTGTECAVSGGFGYWRVGVDYSYDDSFDLDIRIDRVANPLSVYGDPHSTAADSSDWNSAFVVDRMPKKVFEETYKDAEPVNWNDDAWSGVGEPWIAEDTVMVAEWWKREKVARTLVMMRDTRNGQTLVYDKKTFLENEELQALVAQGLVEFVREREGTTHKVTQRIVTGAQVLEETAWKGCYIPIIPVYGDEFNIEGKRYFRSLIHNAKDAQRMFNYWRTASTELVALAPRVPWVGPKGAFNTDQERWNTANSQNHAYLEYDGNTPPTRVPLDSGVAAGALQEALNASDDIKAIIGLYDASLGAKSNETSGRAIMARQREGDVSTFHFIDNMARAIRHTGRVIIDLIPKIYNTERVLRVMGEDGKESAVAVNQPVQEQQDDGSVVQHFYDLTAGKYDLTVTTGPSFTTRREEAAFQMTEMMRALPASAPVLGKHLAKNLDWPGADEIADELEALSGGKLPPEAQKLMEEGQKRIQELEQENQQLKQDNSADIAKAQQEIASKERIAQIEIESDERIAMFKAQSDARVATFKAQLQAEASVAAAANRPAPQQRPAN